MNPSSMSPEENRAAPAMSSGCKLKWDGDKVMSTIERVALESLWMAGQDAITQSLNDVPLDTGTLRRSGVVTVDAPPQAAAVYSEAQSGKGKKSDSVKDKEPPAPTPANKRSPKVVASYNTPYAKRLHETNFTPRDYKLLPNFERKKREQGPELENGQFRKKKWRKIEKPAVGQWKWLERVLPIINRRMQSGVYLRRAKKKVGL